MNVLPQIDRDAAIPLQDQLSEHLRQLIVTGSLKPNSRIIATRFLAEQIGISRMTVLLAYEKLISEGYLETRPAVGTFVSSTPPDNPKPNIFHDQSNDVPRQSTLRPALIRLPALSHSKGLSGIIDFRPVTQDASLAGLPKTWMKDVRDAIARNPNGFAASQLVAGIPSLRQSVSEHIAMSRGIQAAPDQIIIVASSRQACSLISHLFQRAGDRIAVEFPGNRDIAHFFTARGANIVNVPVDEFGLETDLLPGGKTSLAYVSPTRQDPTGGIMPHSRRVALVQWARDAEAYVIEDDSGIGPHYQGIRPPPIITLDPFGLTFYIGCLARVMGPALNLHYLIVPPEFVDPILAIKSATDSGCSWLEQVVAADLLSRGIYDQHLRRFRKACLERRDCLVSALRKHFGDVRLFGTESGTQLTWLLPDHIRSARAVCEAALAHGVYVESAVNEPRLPDQKSSLYDRAIMLAYAGCSPQQLQRGIALLAQAVAA